MEEDSASDPEPLLYGTPESRRILAKKLDVLKLVNGRGKEAVKEALLVASKLQTDLSTDLRRCSQYDLATAQKLQEMYIKCLAITLELLKVLDGQGAVMIGKGEFLPNNKLNSISKWLKPRLKFGRSSDFVWGSPVTSTHPEVLKRRKLFEEVHKTWIKIEYDPSLSVTAKEEASQMIVSELKAFVDPDALEYASVLTHTLGGHQNSKNRAPPPRCYLCFAYDERLCDDCTPKIHQQRLAIVCKKIGNWLLEPMVRAKSDMASKEWTKIRKETVVKSETTQRESRLAHMKANLESIRQHNQEKQQRIEQMRSQIAMLSQDNATAEPILKDAKARLETLQMDIVARRTLLAQRKLVLADARHTSLIDMHLIHAIALHGVENPTEIPGFPRVPRPPRNLRASAMSPAPGSALLGASTFGGGGGGAPAPSSSSSSSSPSSALAATAKPAATPPSLIRPDWHFLHQSVSVEGTLLRALSPSSTLIPFLVFMQQVAIWWNCHLPYPINPMPIPKIYNPSIVNPKLRNGSIPSKDGWHFIPVVSSSEATLHEQQLHQMIAENARTLIRAVGTLPEEAIDLSNAWLNTFFWVFNIEYVRAYHNTTPQLESSHHRARSNSKPPASPGPILQVTPVKETSSVVDTLASSLSRTLQLPSTPNTVVIPPPNDSGWISFLR